MGKVIFLLTAVCVMLADGGYAVRDASVCAGDRPFRCGPLGRTSAASGSKSAASGGYCYWTIADVTVLNKKLGFCTAQGLFDVFWNPKPRGKDFLRYLSEERFPYDARVVRISGLDVLSDLTEGTALLDSVVDCLCKTK